MDFITQPTLFCPFPAAINPHADAVQDHTTAWARRLGLVRDEQALTRFRAARFGRLAARAYPNAALPELEIVSDWNVWLFMLDDQCDEGGIGKTPGALARLFASLMAVLRTPPGAQPSSPLAAGLHDLWSRMAPRSTADWQARFIQDADDYFQACLWEATNRQDGRVPSVADYIAWRPLTGGLITDVDLIDLTEHIVLPAPVRQHTILRRMTEMANNVVCWSNDIISLEKERQRGDVHNLVIAVRHEQDCGWQEAVDRVAALHDEQVRGFLALERLVPRWEPEVDAGVRTYLGVLRSWMRGNLDWAYETGRYSQGEAVPADALEGITASRNGVHGGDRQNL